MVEEVMSIEKAELKALVANNIGAGIEDQLEQAQRLEHNYEGGQQALKKAKQNLAVILTHLQKDFDEGALNEVDVSEPEKLKLYVGKWLARCHVMLEETKEEQYRGQLGAAGMVAGLKKAMGVPKKYMDEALGKVEAIKRAIEEGTLKQNEDGSLEETEPGKRPGARPAGVRPADPLAGVKGRKGKSNGKKPYKRVAEPKKAKPKKAKAKKSKKTETKRKCSICRRSGHTSRTCPKAN